VYLKALSRKSFGTNGDFRSIVGLMKHAKIVWNFNIRQWFCTSCGRTSDRAAEPEARVELDQFDCQLPYVEILSAIPGEETVRLIKTPFKMKPKDEPD
jgi:hypothetical protein